MSDDEVMSHSLRLADRIFNNRPITLDALSVNETIAVVLVLDFPE